MAKPVSLLRKDVSPKVKFWLALIGGFTGYYIGFHMIFKDYQFVKYTPPEKDENGNVIRKPLKVTFREMTPLELTPEAKLKQEELKRLKDAE